MIEDSFQAPLSNSIRKEYNKMMEAISKVSNNTRTSKVINFTGGDVSVSDLLAYQIGWGKLVISWYNIGTVQGQTPQMPGEGFTSWSYEAIAKHFYKKWQLDQGPKQEQALHEVVTEILEIVEKEHKTGNLNKEGAWNWCTLQSGKKWPLSKWIKVNTSSPYKRASSLIRKLEKQ